MDISYLGNEQITDDDLNLVHSRVFSDATKDAEQRDKDHPDDLNKRFNTVTNPEFLKCLQKGFSLFQKHISDGNFNMEIYLNDLDQQIKGYKETFRGIGNALKIQNLDIPSSAIVINGGPVGEMQQRVKDSVAFISEYNPDIIITSGGDTQISKDIGFSSEAQYIKSQLENNKIGGNILTEDNAQHTGENAQFVSNLLGNVDSMTTFTTDYGSLRVALTNQCQMPFAGKKRTHGSEFRYNDNILWSPNEWWMTESGWRATMYSLSRLIRYRARTDPFI
ncbi:YdcF family protein [Candidatus Gracilibacteria bacterium]|nr:YdcF family protein [Candidatus Gracilibacteria bacterium]